MTRKIYKAKLNLKADDKGTFEAVFARFNVIDHDSDVTLPGAFQQGQRVVIEGWNHDQGLPVGAGHIHSDGEKALVAGHFFLDTTAGRDHYNTVKALKPEWSYTFEIVESEHGTFHDQQVRFLKALDVWGVSPVTRGAGIGTELVTIKRRGRRRRLDPIDAQMTINVLSRWLEIHREYRQADPKSIRIMLDDALVGAEITYLESQVAGAGGDHPTNRYQVRERIRRQWPDTSKAYINLLTGAALQRIAILKQRNNPNLSEHQAWLQTYRWSRQPS
jgi:hypothetical protein